MPERVERFRVGRRRYQRGDLFQLKGERGKRYRLHALVVSGEHYSIEAWGPVNRYGHPKAGAGLRSFAVEAVVGSGSVQVEML